MMMFSKLLSLKIGFTLVVLTMRTVKGQENLVTTANELTKEGVSEHTTYVPSLRAANRQAVLISEANDSTKEGMCKRTLPFYHSSLICQRYWLILILQLVPLILHKSPNWRQSYSTWCTPTLKILINMDQPLFRRRRANSWLLHCWEEPHQVRWTAWWWLDDAILQCFPF